MRIWNIMSNPDQKNHLHLIWLEIIDITVARFLPRAVWIPDRLFPSGGSQLVPMSTRPMSTRTHVNSYHR